MDEELLLAGERLGIDPLDLLEGIRQQAARRQMHDAIQSLLGLGDRPWDESTWTTSSAGWW